MRPDRIVMPQKNPVGDPAPTAVRVNLWVPSHLSPYHLELLKNAACHKPSRLYQSLTAAGVYMNPPPSDIRLGNGQLQLLLTVLDESTLAGWAALRGQPSPVNPPSIVVRIEHRPARQAAGAIPAVPATGQVQMQLHQQVAAALLPAASQPVANQLVAPAPHPHQMPRQPNPGVTAVTSDQQLIREVADLQAAASQAAQLVRQMVEVERVLQYSAATRARLPPVPPAALRPTAAQPVTAVSSDQQQLIRHVADMRAAASQAAQLVRQIAEVMRVMQSAVAAVGQVRVPPPAAPRMWRGTGQCRYDNQNAASRIKGKIGDGHFRLVDGREGITMAKARRDNYLDPTGCRLIFAPSLAVLVDDNGNEICPAEIDNNRSDGSSDDEGEDDGPTCAKRMKMTKKQRDEARNERARCIVCLSGRPDTAVQPCLHLNMHASCASTYMSLPKHPCLHCHAENIKSTLRITFCSPLSSSSLLDPCASSAPSTSTAPSSALPCASSVKEKKKAHSCASCGKANPKAVSMPSGRVCLCWDCAEKLIDQPRSSQEPARCPRCRQPIDNIQKLKY